MSVLKKARVYMLSVHIHTAEAARTTCLSAAARRNPPAVCLWPTAIDRDAFQT